MTRSRTFSNLKCLSTRALWQWIGGLFVFTFLVQPRLVGAFQHPLASLRVGGVPIKPTSAHYRPFATDRLTTVPSSPTNNRHNHGRSSASALHCIKPAILWTLSSVAIGASGTPLVAKATKTWYNDIPLPSFTPPNVVFAPVWTTLYTLMGIASWRIRSIVINPASVSTLSASSIISVLQKHVISLSLVHYALNIAWAPIFFGLKRLRAGHVLNNILIATLIPIIFIYATIDRISSLMLVPYLAWLVLATKLSSEVCRLNPTSIDLFGTWWNNAKLQDMIWKLRIEAGKKVGL